MAVLVRIVDPKGVVTSENDTASGGQPSPLAVSFSFSKVVLIGFFNKCEENTVIAQNQSRQGPQCQDQTPTSRSEGRV